MATTPSPMPPVGPLAESAAPAYLALADELGSRIARLPAGARVPSEHELVDTSGVSRLTARAALQELERRLLVRRVRGAGTFVAPRLECRIGPAMPLGAAEVVQRAGGGPGDENVSVRTRRPPADVRDALELGGDDRVVAIVRTASVDGLPASFSTSFVPADLAPDLAEHLVAGRSIDAVLRDRYGLDPRRLRGRAELAVVPADVAPHLGVEGRPLAWHLEGTSHDPTLARPVELSRTWARADVFRVVFELGRDTGDTGR